MFPTGRPCVDVQSHCVWPFSLNVTFSRISPQAHRHTTWSCGCVVGSRCESRIRNPHLGQKGASIRTSSATSVTGLSTYSDVRKTDGSGPARYAGLSCCTP